MVQNGRWTTGIHTQVFDTVSYNQLAMAVVTRDLEVGLSTLKYRASLHWIERPPLML